MKAIKNKQPDMNELPYTIHSHQPVDPRTGYPHADNYGIRHHHPFENLKSGFTFAASVKNFFLLKHNAKESAIKLEKHIELENKNFFQSPTKLTK